MKHRSTQLATRKNPDSPRVHGLRLAANPQPSKGYLPSASEDEEAPPNVPTGVLQLSRSEKVKESSPEGQTSHRPGSGEAPARPGLLGVWKNSKAVFGTIAKLPARKVLAVPRRGNPGLGVTSARRVPCCLTSEVHSKPTQNKLNGPFMEESGWLVDAFSKDQYSSGELSAKSG